MKLIIFKLIKSILEENYPVHKYSDDEIKQICNKANRDIIRFVSKITNIAVKENLKFNKKITF